MANWIDDLFGGRDATTDKGDKLAQNPDQAQQSKASGSDYPHYTQYRDSYGTNKDGSKSDGAIKAGSWHKSDEKGSSKDKTSYSYDENHPLNASSSSSSDFKASDSSSSASNNSESFNLFDPSTW